MSVEPHYVIDLSDGTRLHVDTTAGPLSGVNVEDDPADGAAALWRAIEDHDPIYVNGATGPSMPRDPLPRAWYPNLAHVVALFELGDLTRG